MKRKYLLAAVFGGLLGFWVSVPAAAKTQAVRYRSGEETVSGYLAAPESAGRHPALIVIHEWWGLVPWVRQETEKFAAAGYVALAVDLYRGKNTNQPQEARQLVSTLPPDRAMRDLEAAFHYLSQRRDVDPSRIGTVGWCFGGGWALRLAIHEPKLAACAINYGQLTTDLSSLQAIRCPVLGNFGAQDPSITPEQVRAFEATMKQLGKRIDIKIYPGASHAFQNPNDKMRYRPRPAADAWKRMVIFFNRTLR